MVEEQGIDPAVGGATGERRRRGRRGGRLAARWPLPLRRASSQAHRARRLTVETTAGRAQYVAVGSGPPVILLHGLDGSSRWWAPTMRALAGTFRCYALEFVVFDRWRERGRVPLARAGDFVAAWLAALGLDWAHVVAHSMGAHAALSLALRRSELVGRLVLVAPAVLPVGRRPGRREVARMVPFFTSLAPDFLPVLATDALRTGPLRWLRSAQELWTAASPDLAGIHAPTLLLWGARDVLVPPEHGPVLQRRIAGSRLVTIPGAGHVPMFERPAECNAAIGRFLRGETVGAGADD